MLIQLPPASASRYSELQIEALSSSTQVGAAEAVGANASAAAPINSPAAAMVSSCGCPFVCFHVCRDSLGLGQFQNALSNGGGWYLGGGGGVYDGYDG